MRLNEDRDFCQGCVRLGLKRVGDDERCWKWLAVVRRGFESEEMEIFKEFRSSLLRLGKDE